MAAALIAAEAAKTAYTDAGGEITDTDYVALEDALADDPQVLDTIQGAIDDLEAATEALVTALADAVTAAETAQAAFVDALGDITEGVYTDLEDALAADPQVLADIENATDALEAATALLV